MKKQLGYIYHATTDLIFDAKTSSLMPSTHRRRDETVLSRRRRRCEHNSQLAHDDCRQIRSTICKLAKHTP